MGLSRVEAGIFFETELTRALCRFLNDLGI